jgi:hypothetical protein
MSKLGFIVFVLLHSSLMGLYTIDKLWGGIFASQNSHVSQLYGLGIFLTIIALMVLLDFYQSLITRAIRYFRKKIYKRNKE